LRGHGAEVYNNPEIRRLLGYPETGALPSPIQNSKNSFGSATVATSPIVLDLDGDGVETTREGLSTYFDHNADGFAESTGWAGGGDGVLVRDLDGDGQIESGRELFGSETLLSNGTKAANGFVALSELDTNHDGKVDINDAGYSSLKVWKDIDGDGYTSDGELLTLTEAGVQSISTIYTTSGLVDANGNHHKQIGSYTTVSGVVHAAEDIWFNVDKVNTIAENWLEVPQDIALLPDLSGYGNVYDLHQAMVRDTAGILKELISQFITATTTQARESILESIIFRWTGASNYLPNSRGSYIGDARKLYVVEAILGEKFIQYAGTGAATPDPAPNAAKQILASYQSLFDYFYAELLTQTVLKPVFDLMQYRWNNETKSLYTDILGAANFLKNTIAQDVTAEKTII
jgi:hypothetical protein